MDPEIKKTGIREDQVYEYSVSGAEVEVVFADNKTVVLETESGHRRYEETGQFKDGIGNQWELVETSTGDRTQENDQTPNSNAFKEGQKEQKEKGYTTFEIIQSTLRLLREKFEHNEKDVTGQKTQTIDEILELLPTSEPEEIDFDDVDGVGAGTAQNLQDRGIVYKIHLKAAREEYIRDTKGIGNKSYQSLMEQAS